MKDQQTPFARVSNLGNEELEELLPDVATAARIGVALIAQAMAQKEGRPFTELDARKILTEEEDFKRWHKWSVGK